MSAGFWFTAGLLAGATGTLVAVPLWRSTAGWFTAGRARHALALAAVVAVFALSAAMLYLFVGSPHTLEHGGASGTASRAPAAGMPGGKAQSMEEATAGLKARLESQGGSAQDWQLLAQSYDFLGKPEEARRARERAAGMAGAGAPTAASATGGSMGSALQPTPPVGLAPPDGAAPNAPEEASEQQLEHRVKSRPGDAAGWLSLADLRRRHREFRQARAAYLRVIALKAMTAQSWADEADVEGSLAGGTLGPAAAQAIDRALALDPDNAKALWLKASREHQDHHEAAALADWKHLKAVLAPGSPDIALVDANIDEAARLSGVRSDAASGARQDLATDAANAASSPGSVSISGTVSISSRLGARLEPSATLFIYAKSVDSPGPPLAVMRTSISHWPVSFRLDDSMAMLPSRRLSQFQKVVIEARISRSGQALPAPGDLYATSEVLRPADARDVVLVIDREIGS